VASSGQYHIQLKVVLGDICLQMSREVGNGERESERAIEVGKGVFIYGIFVERAEIRITQSICLKDVFLLFYFGFYFYFFFFFSPLVV